MQKVNTKDNKTIVFDLDGTLVDTLNDLATAVNSSLLSCGYPTHSLSDYRYYVGNGVWNLVRRALPLEQQNDPLIVQHVKELFDKYYSQMYLNSSAPYPGIIDLLNALKAHGMQLAVVSNKPHKFTCAMVEHFFPDIFLCIFGHRDGIAKKPDPVSVLEAAKICKGNSLWYIGDSDVDIETGKNARASTIGCSWGFRGEKELLEAKADFIAQRPSDILRILEKSD